MTTTPWYDTREGLTARLDAGLEGFREIQRERHAAYYDRNETLHAWMLLGRFQLDRCGNLYMVTRGAPADRWRDSLSDVIPVISRDEAREISGNMTSYAWSVPIERCDRCGNAWTMRNIDECVWISRQPFDVPRHRACQRLHLAQQSYEDLGRIVKRSEISVCSKRLIPNEYHPDDLYFPPWMLVETPYGRIRLGWRKRVINLDWGESTLKTLNVAEIFADEDVTKLESGIHAWSEDKAVEYLRKVWTHGGTK